MFNISVAHSIDAAHRLENYNGACSRLHGHTYTITGVWEKDTLDHIGMTLDMVELKKRLRQVTVDMDHNHLNKIKALPKPTAECMAQLIFSRLQKFPNSGKYLRSVTVLETPGCSIIFTPGRATQKTANFNLPEDTTEEDKQLCETDQLDEKGDEVTNAN
jgi:6-pyruvoyltetrahydropterin/6-carboxytetrahydropterin synthase